MNIFVIINIVLFVVIAVVSTIAMVVDRNNHKKLYNKAEEHDCNSDHFDLIFQIGIGVICLCTVIIALFAMSL